MDYGPLLIVVVLIGIGLIWAVRRKPAPAAKNKSRQSGMQISLSKAQFQEQWAAIEAKMAQPGIDQTRSAVMEADKLMDMGLRQSGFRGETMGERLKSAREHFNNNAVYQGIWEAHKMRNALAHEIGFDLPKQAGLNYLALFKAGLQYLKLL